MCRFEATDALGKRILESNPDDKDVKTKLTQLSADQRIIEELWRKKEANLRDAREMQVGHLYYNSLSVTVHSLQVAILAQSSREISQTVRIKYRSFLSRVRISVQPSKFFIGENPPKKRVLTRLWPTQDRRLNCFDNFACANTWNTSYDCTSPGCSVLKCRYNCSCVNIVFITCAHSVFVWLTFKDLHKLYIEYDGDRVKKREW